MTVFGLPFHPLVVHATVVVVPAAALAVLVSTFWPRFARWASWSPLALAALALVLVPVTTSSGESLERALPHSTLVDTHAQLADGLLPWVVALLVGAFGVWWPRLSVVRPGLWSPPRWVRVAAAVIATAAALGTLVEVVLIGHSGAAAAWSQVGSTP